MIYKPFQDHQLSRLGMGNMRLPVNRGKIDKKKAQEIIDYAMEQGINYYDTAYVYHSGESESFLGEALSKHPPGQLLSGHQVLCDGQPQHRAGL